MKECRLMCYTRVPEEDAVYSAKLADSMHLAVDLGDGEFIPLNHNAGVLYAKATQNADGTLNAMNLVNPWMFQLKTGTYGIIAKRIRSYGEEDTSSKGKLLFFETQDFCEYTEHELLDLPEIEYIEDAICSYHANQDTYVIQWKNQTGKWFSIEVKSLSDINPDVSKKEICEVTNPIPKCLIKGAKSRNIINVEEELALRLYRKLTVPVNTANEVPLIIHADSPDKIKRVKALARYSDGSTVEKPIDWETSGIDFNKPGKYRITGKVQQKHFNFPIALHRADPCVGKWGGRYYFIATNDADGNHTLYMRESETIEGLVDAPESLILDTNTYPHIKGLLWAPEFHVIKGKLYIFHAATPNEFGREHCHVMTLKENGNPMKASDWTPPERVLRKDGSMLYGEEGITLDMTEYEVNGRYYVMWSQRQFKPVDQGAWVFIAEINPDEPWKLISDPLLISMPEFGWANNHTFVDEGPFALITDKKLFVTISSAAVDSTYVVGLLSADLDADLLNPDNWKKCNYPLMSSRAKEGEYGTGHNAYIQDEDGLIWNTYHAKVGINGPRSSGFRRVHFDGEGYPVLEMTEEMDLVPELAEVSMEVIVD